MIRSRAYRCTASIMILAAAQCLVVACKLGQKSTVKSEDGTDTGAILSSSPDGFDYSIPDDETELLNVLSGYPDGSPPTLALTDNVIPGESELPAPTGVPDTELLPAADQLALEGAEGSGGTPGNKAPGAEGTNAAGLKLADQPRITEDSQNHVLHAAHMAAAGRDVTQRTALAACISHGAVLDKTSNRCLCVGWGMAIQGQSFQLPPRNRTAAEPKICPAIYNNYCTCWHTRTPGTCGIFKKDDQYHTPALAYKQMHNLDSAGGECYNTCGELIRDNVATIFAQNACPAQFMIRKSASVAEMWTFNRSTGAPEGQVLAVLPNTPTNGINGINGINGFDPTRLPPSGQTGILTNNAAPTLGGFPPQTGSTGSLLGTGGNPINSANGNLTSGSPTTVLANTAQTALQDTCQIIHFGNAFAQWNPATSSCICGRSSTMTQSNYNILGPSGKRDFIAQCFRALLDS